MYLTFQTRYFEKETDDAERLLAETEWCGVFSMFWVLTYHSPVCRTSGDLDSVRKAAQQVIEALL